MLYKFILCLVCCLSALHGQSQFTDDFSDGDFTHQPAWTGNPADWGINNTFQLQSQSTTANALFGISTVSTLATVAEWRLSITLGFNPSSANYMDVYLMASLPDLTDPACTGYFVRLGGSDDEVSLYRKDAGTAVVKIIDGTDGLLNSSNHLVQLRVIRDNNDQWVLRRNHNGSGEFTEGMITDQVYLSSAFFGILIRQSSAAFFQKHVVDDITAEPFIPDTAPPVLLSITATGPQTADIRFNEPVDLLASQIPAHYSADQGLGIPVSVTRDSADQALVHLRFTGSFPSRRAIRLSVIDIPDLYGNLLSSAEKEFIYYVPAAFDLVIHEIMADPSPPVSLPAAEWIELYNRSGMDINLQGWRLGKLSSTSAPFAAYVLKADSSLILCSTGAASSLSSYGTVLPVVSFPSLSNEGDLIFLKAANGQTIHTVSYSADWYQNDLKKEGGWTLEMIDPDNPCSGKPNWSASDDMSGGTPGRINSVSSNNPDEQGPQLLRAYVADSVSVVLVFNEPMDSVLSSVPQHYLISDGIGNPLSAQAIPPEFNRILLRLSVPVTSNTIYTVAVQSPPDCAGNAMSSGQEARVALPLRADSQDLLINEILFNPRPAGNDFVELYNRSNKVLDLKNLYIASRNSAGAMSSIVRLSEEPYAFFPGEYMVVTENRSLVLSEYVAEHPDAFVEIASMPSLPDDEGHVLIINEQGRVVDELKYSDDWHFPLISNAEGVSLERIDPVAATNNKDNWMSASTGVGYATPTYHNSQQKNLEELPGEMTVEPAVFSPDQDGQDDIAFIRYRFPEPGYLSNITIFDASGRPVRYLKRNALNGISGYYRWDGLDEKNQPLATGMYIVFAEVFNLNGQTKKFKKMIVLARRKS